MTNDGKYSDFQLWRRVLRQARPCWPHIVGLFALSLLTTPLSLLGPLPMKIVVDSVLGSHPLPGMLGAILPDGISRSPASILVVAVGLLVAVALLSQLQDLATAMLRVHTGQRLVLGFRSQLFRHLQRLSLSFHDTRGTADSIYRIQSDAPAIQSIAIDGVIPFIVASMTLVTMLFIIIRLDWQLALVALAISPVLATTAHFYRRRLRHGSREVKTLESAAQAVLHEVLGALRVVKAFGQEEREEERFVERSSQSMRARLRVTFAEGGFGLLAGVTTAVGTAMVLFVGARHVSAGALTLGELLLVMSYLGQLYGPLRTISRKAGSLQSHLASAERAFAVLDQEPDVMERPNARPLVRAVGNISFHHVSFRYDGRRMVLRDVSYQIPAGTRVGIAGMTGAGKTTLISLLIRFYDPVDGDILLDGVDLRDYRLADLRNQFAVVLQDPVLFSASIAENIAYGRPNASEQEIVDAAKAANAHPFVAQLPDGYQTVIGERGMQLSGGERQRIALARAFLKDAPILILDEPTSSVDLRTESEIMDALTGLMQGRTTIMIAHRTNTLQNCDVIVRIENGQLVPASARPGLGDEPREPGIALPPRAEAK